MTVEIIIIVLEVIFCLFSIYLINLMKGYSNEVGKIQGKIENLPDIKKIEQTISSVHTSLEGELQKYRQGLDWHTCLREERLKIVMKVYNKLMDTYVFESNPQMHEEFKDLVHRQTPILGSELANVFLEMFALLSLRYATPDDPMVHGDTMKKWEEIIHMIYKEFDIETSSEELHEKFRKTLEESVKINS